MITIIATTQLHFDNLILILDLFLGYTCINVMLQIIFLACIFMCDYYFIAFIYMKCSTIRLITEVHYVSNTEI